MQPGQPRRGADVPADPNIAHLRRLQDLRRPRERVLEIDSVLARTAASARRDGTRLAAVAELWERHVPAPLADATRLEGLRSGTLQVTASSSAVAYQLDRHLRGGAEQAMRREFRGTLRRVRVRVGSLDAGARS